jgi:hypothetical protein
MKTKPFSAMERYINVVLNVIGMHAFYLIDVSILVHHFAGSNI